MGGSGKILINQRPLEEYFPNDEERRAVNEVLDAVDQRQTIDIVIRVKGGGTTGQAGACRMGIARALVGHDFEFYEKLRDGGFLTRDSRMKERKIRPARRPPRHTVLE